MSFCITDTISYTIPVHKRTQDFIASLPDVVLAANASPPVQIIVVDYGEQPPLEPLIAPHRNQLIAPSYFTVVEYRKRQHYHMGHARNLSIRAAEGAYTVISSADVYPRPHFFSTVRQQLLSSQADYLRSMTNGYIGVVTVRTDLLVATGGFDERFECWGREDKDLLGRFIRRGMSVSYYDLDDLIILNVTPPGVRRKNYRLGEHACKKLRNAVYEENLRNQVLTVNDGVAWGSLDQ